MKGKPAKRERNPIMTDRILHGIIVGLAVHEAGGVADMCGSESEQDVKDYDDAMAALHWARRMVWYREGSK